MNIEELSSVLLSRKLEPEQYWDQGPTLQMGNGFVILEFNQWCHRAEEASLELQSSG